jgi:hypothetical protein
MLKYFEHKKMIDIIVNFFSDCCLFRFYRKRDYYRDRDYYGNYDYYMFETDPIFSSSTVRNRKTYRSPVPFATSFPCSVSPFDGTYSVSPLQSLPAKIPPTQSSPFTSCLEEHFSAESSFEFSSRNSSGGSSEDSREDSVHNSSEDPRENFPRGSTEGSREDSIHNPSEVPRENSPMVSSEDSIELETLAQGEGWGCNLPSPNSSNPSEESRNSSDFEVIDN